jgi:hypothetical protein
MSGFTNPAALTLSRRERVAAEQPGLFYTQEVKR